MSITIPAVEIELDKPRKLIEDFNAIATFEELTGINALDPQAMLEKDEKGNFIVEEVEIDGSMVPLPKVRRLSGTQLRARLFALLLRDDPDLSLEEVGGMVHGGNIEYVWKKLDELDTLTAPEPSDKEGNGEEADPTN